MVVERNLDKILCSLYLWALQRYRYGRLFGKVAPYLKTNKICSRLQLQNTNKLTKMERNFIITHAKYLKFNWNYACKYVLRFKARYFLIFFYIVCKWLKQIWYAWNEWISMKDMILWTYITHKSAYWYSSRIFD